MYNLYNSQVNSKFTFLDNAAGQLLRIIKLLFLPA
jgi:hypothetical protein